MVFEAFKYVCYMHYVYTSCGVNIYLMNIHNQHGNCCYPPFWWSKLPVVIVLPVLDNEASDIEVH